MALRFGNGIIIDTGGGSPVTGFLLPIGDPNTGDGDGSLSDGAVPLTETHSVSYGVDKINEYLLKLVPTAPTLFPNGTLVESGYTNGLNPTLCDGVIPDNTSGGTIPATTAGDDVTIYRGTGNSVTSSNILDSGKGDSGSIYVHSNNTKGGELLFTTGTGDNINFDGLQVTDNVDYPTTQPGFHQSFDARVNSATAANGWNRYLLTYQDSDLNEFPTNELYILKDNLTSAPTVLSGALTESIVGTFNYSSGIPSYKNGTTLTMTGATLNQMSGYTYNTGDPLEVSSASGGLTNGNPTYSYAALGIVTPLPVDATGIMTSFDVILNATNSHVTDTMRLRARNTNGWGPYLNLSAIGIRYMAGTTTGVDEDNIQGPNSTAYRVDLGIGSSLIDAPSVVLPSTPVAMDPEQELTTPNHNSEAVVVGAVLRHDTSNYDTADYMPLGPDYTLKKADSQYIDFVLTEPSLSKFDINITGTYSGLWIGLEGWSDDVAICPNSVSTTWWDGFVAYNGSGLPGRLGASAGCADGLVPAGTSGSYTMTFGTANTSKNSNGTDAVSPKNIFVRLMLASGESITNLTFS